MGSGRAVARSITRRSIRMPIRRRGFAEARVEPEGAFYSKDYGEFILPYDRVARAASPDETLLEFLQSTYEAAAKLGAWDRVRSGGQLATVGGSSRVHGRLRS